MNPTALGFQWDYNLDAGPPEQALPSVVLHTSNLCCLVDQAASDTWV
jgi:hypothetical protein